MYTTISKVPFYNRPLTLFAGHCIESYIFPTCAPFESKDDAFATPPKEQMTIHDLKHAILRKWKMVVYYTVDLRKKPANLASRNDVLSFPLQGGPNAILNPNAIESICVEIHRRCPTTMIVHCTHGLNRTLLILAALFLKDNPTKSVDEALMHVKRIRPPGILRSNVVDSLTTWKQTFLR